MLKYRTGRPNIWCEWERAKIFEYLQVASNMKDECEFLAGFGETVDKMHPPGHDIVAFRSFTYNYD